MLEAPEHHAGQQHQRLAVRLRLQIGDDRHLADVVGGLAHHFGERLVDRRDVGEVERDAIGRDLVALQRRGVRIVAERDAKRLLRGHLATTVIELASSPRVCQTSIHRTITMQQHHCTTRTWPAHDFDLVQRRCRQAPDDAGMHRRAGRSLCRAGGGPRHHPHALRLHHADAASPDAVYGLKSMDGVCPKLGVGAVRINSDIVTFPEAGQHHRAREGAGGARQPLVRAGAAVLGRQRRAAGDHAGRRDAAHARRRHQRPRHQVSRAQERRDGRHPRLGLAGRLAADGRLRGARHQADPLLQPDPRAPRSIRGAR